MIPRWMVYSVVALVVLSWVPLALIARSRASKSEQPRVHLVPDMDSQSKYKAQKVNALFADTRAMRQPVLGTVARGELRDDDHRYRGMNADGSWATRFPLPVTPQLLERGQNRFNIYCYPCHGYAGEGNGPIAVRADRLQEGTWIPPSNLSDDVVVGRAVGHIFNSISNGIRTMPSYAAQIPVDDRWAIVAYVRALQRSHRGTLADVPADLRSSLN